MRRGIGLVVRFAALAGVAGCMPNPEPELPKEKEARNLWEGKADKATGLTPRDAAEGWLVLYDGHSTFGWAVEGTAKVEKGTLILGGKTVTRARLTTGFGDCELLGEIAGEGKLLARGPSGEASLGVGGEGSSRLRLGTRKSDAKGLELTGHLNGASEEGPPQTVALLTHEGDQPVYFGFEVPAGRTLSVRSLRLLPRGLSDLWNGTDFTGWKEYPGKKSEFAITREGWLRVKGGPGDIQSVGRFDDFVLQADCMTTNEYLNSGIFFRCVPGEYQQGYEAQIRNEFHETADVKYQVEDFDPKTNKSLGKRTVLSPAVDYGTGGIYRHAPARKEASRDRAWFTLTVVAHGRHFATWVNGQMEVDWTDNRPADDNPRKGYRAQKGHVSIQGHDSKTDLNFRRVRLVPLN